MTLPCPFASPGPLGRKEGAMNKIGLKIAIYVGQAWEGAKSEESWPQSKHKAYKVRIRHLKQELVRKSSLEVFNKGPSNSHTHKGQAKNVYGENNQFETIGRVDTVADWSKHTPSQKWTYLQKRNRLTDLGEGTEGFQGERVGVRNSWGVGDWHTHAAIS